MGSQGDRTESQYTCMCVKSKRVSACVSKLTFFYIFLPPVNAEVLIYLHCPSEHFLLQLSRTDIEENNRIGKTRDLFKKITDTKRTFHAKMGTKKERNGMDLTEAEDIKEVVRIHRRTVQKRFMSQITTMM